MKQTIDAAELRRILRYEPATGEFRWLAPGNRRIIVGSLAGVRSHGYVRIKIDGRGYMAHRLAWLYMTGSWPEADVDHIDLERSNNAWANLRGATRRQNLANTKPRRCGLKGASFDRERGKYVSHIRVAGKQRFLGRFDSEADAHAAYMAAANQAYGEFARAA